MVVLPVSWDVDVCSKFKMAAKFPEVPITMLVLQIHLSFQKQYRGLWLCTKHLNVHQSWPTLPRVENPRCQPTNRKYWYLRKYDMYHQHSNDEPIRHSTMANSQEVYLGDSYKDRQSETAAETGNTYISETLKSTVKISMTNLGYKTTCRWKIVSASNYSSDRQPEISIWPPKLEIITSAEFWQMASKFQRQIRSFRWFPARQKISQMIASTIDHQKLHNWRANVSIAISGRRSLSQSLCDTLFGLAVVENPGLAVGISTLSVVVPVV